jgi:hypothetical protein
LNCTIRSGVQGDRSDAKAAYERGRARVQRDGHRGVVRRNHGEAKISEGIRVHECGKGDAGPTHQGEAGWNGIIVDERVDDGNVNIACAIDGDSGPPNRLALAAPHADTDAANVGCRRMRHHPDLRRDGRL